LKDIAGKGLFFIQIFSLFLSDVVSKCVSNHHAGRFLKDVTEDALRGVQYRSPGGATVPAPNTKYGDICSAQR
jgi:hypothetical protein